MKAQTQLLLGYWFSQILIDWKPALKFERIWNTFKIVQLLNEQLTKAFMCSAGRKAVVLSRQCLLQFVSTIKMTSTEGQIRLSLF